MTLRHGMLDILRVVIAAPDDDQVLDATCHDELPVVKESEVTSAEERPFPGIAQVRVEGLLSLARLLPISLSDVVPGQPNLADAVRRAAGARLPIDNLDLLVQPCPTAFVKDLCVFAACRHDEHMMALECLSVDTHQGTPPQSR